MDQQRKAPRNEYRIYLNKQIEDIALCRDIHWAFDKGFITLDNELKVNVHPDVTSYWLNSFNDKSIFIPEDPFFRPAIENIEYHRNNIYGLFLTSGRL